MTGPEAAQGIARGIHVAAAMSIFGSALFRAVIAPPAPGSDSVTPTVRRRLALLAWGSLAVAALAGLVWLMLQAAAFADGESIADILAAVPLILLDTHFGLLMAARFALLLPACLVLQRVAPRNASMLPLSALLSAGAVALQVLLGHGISMQGDARVLLVAGETLHILAAGAWLGGLAPLMLVVAGSAAADCARAVRRFSIQGLCCVIALLVTSLIQAWLLIGGLPGLLGTDYGRLALAKLALLIGLLTLAALNRYWLRPELAGADGEVAKRQLVWSVLAETAVGLGVLILAGMLLMLAPAIRQQPDWPFPWMLNLSPLSRPGSMPALVVVGMVAGLASIGAAIVARRWRIAAAVLGMLLFATAFSQAGVLLVPAHPTSFYRSPTGFTAASIVHGGKLFAEDCATCHHTDSDAAQTGAYRDGDLLWLLRHGDGAEMPGLGDRRSDNDLWAVIDFLKTRGIAQRGLIDVPHAAPDLPVVTGEKTVPLARLRGVIIRLVALGKDERATTIPGVTSLRIDPGSDGWAAYAMLAGVDDAGLRHFTFLVDSGGVLRGIFPPTEEGGLDDGAFTTALAAVAPCDATACP